MDYLFCQTLTEIPVCAEMILIMHPLLGIKLLKYFSDKLSKSIWNCSISTVTVLLLLRLKDCNTNQVAYAMHWMMLFLRKYDMTIFYLRDQIIYCCQLWIFNYESICLNSCSYFFAYFIKFTVHLSQFHRQL